MKYEKNVNLQNCSFQKDLQIFLTQFLIKRIFLILILKNTIEIEKFHYLIKICDIRKKR